MNILVLNRKGGSGKSTICDELLFSLERSGTSCAFVDLDDQGSVIHADTSDQADTADVTVIDTPGALTDQVPQWIESADVIVIPTMPSGRDVAMLLAALEDARTYGPDAKRIIAVGRFNRYKAAGEFLDALRKIADEGERITTVAQSENFGRAFVEKRSIVEIAPKTNAGLLMLRTVNAIREAAGLPPDPTDTEVIEEYLKQQAQRAAARKKQRKEPKDARN